MIMAGLHVTSLGPEHAPRVVCLHGFLGQGEDWGPLADRLTHRFRVDLVDLPGHGRSLGLPATSYTWCGAITLLNAYLRGAAALVGYSMGGRLALASALAEPHTLQALVVLSASAGLEDAAARGQREREDEAKAARLEQDGLPAFVRAWYEQPLFASLARHAGLKSRLVQQRTQGVASELARALRGFSISRQPNLWGELATLNVPALFVAGEEDVAYVMHARRAAGLSPQGAGLMVAHSGHMPQLEQPGPCLEGIATFLQQHVE